MPAAVIWLIVALGLAGAEALTGDMFLLMLSGGALAAAGSSWLLDLSVWTDGAVFLVVSVLLLLLVRLRRVLLRLVHHLLQFLTRFALLLRVGALQLLRQFREFFRVRQIGQQREMRADKNHDRNKANARGGNARNRM